MYKFSYFTEEDPAKVIQFIKENSFGVITGFGKQYPVATHIPLDVVLREDGNLLLQGHLMKNTDHHKAFVENENVLVVFNGPHTYVSASWYENPQVASTWNYMAVHARGKIKFTDDAGTYEAIKAITNKYEGTESVAAFDRMPREYVMKMLKAIVGFTIEVEILENVFKLSQNHGETNRQQITAHLKQRGDAHSTAIATEMEQRR
jgi:transcriptional regulator